jgi:aldose 1-epimerase
MRMIGAGYLCRFSGYAGPVLELTAGDACLRLQPEHGGRIAGLTVAGLELLVTPEVDDHNYGAFPMAPWTGRVRDGRFTFDGVDYQLPLNKPPHAIHGTARDHPWTVDVAGDSSAVLTQELTRPWPFGGRVVMRFDLAPGALDLTFEVHAGDTAMPAECGWHPWWQRQAGRGDQLEVEVHASAMYALDRVGIPTGELTDITPPPWDDCFTELGKPAAILHWPGAASVEIATDCPCLVVFTEPENAICVEPESGPPDQFNLGPRVVLPGEPLVVHSTWSWTLH